MDFSADIDTYIKYFGISATYNGTPGKVVFDAPSSFDNGMIQEIALNKYQALMNAKQWTSLKEKDVLVINSKNYIVHSIKYVDDGFLKIVELK